MIKTAILLNVVALPAEAGLLALIALSPSYCGPPFWTFMLCTLGLCFTLNTAGAFVHYETTENQEDE